MEGPRTWRARQRKRGRRDGETATTGELQAEGGGSANRRPSSPSLYPPPSGPCVPKQPTPKRPAPYASRDNRLPAPPRVGRLGRRLASVFLGDPSLRLFVNSLVASHVSTQTPSNTCFYSPHTVCCNSTPRDGRAQGVQQRTHTETRRTRLVSSHTTATPADGDPRASDDAKVSTLHQHTRYALSTLIPSPCTRQPSRSAVRFHALTQPD